MSADRKFPSPTQRPGPIIPTSALDHSTSAMANHDRQRASATPADIERNRWPASIGIRWPTSIGMPGRFHRNPQANDNDLGLMQRIDELFEGRHAHAMASSPGATKSAGAVCGPGRRNGLRWSQTKEQHNQRGQNLVTSHAVIPNHLPSTKPGQVQYHRFCRACCSHNSVVLCSNLGKGVVGLGSQAMN